jgi:hypothetical protein
MLLVHRGARIRTPDIHSGGPGRHVSIKSHSIDAHKSLILLINPVQVAEEHRRTAKRDARGGIGLTEGGPRG